jgi:catechol 2,3-dioxygenase-like lactoylglutathione lyase family enzyme
MRSKSSSYSRRQILGMLGAVPLLPRALAGAVQGAGPAIPIERILGFGIRVPDVGRTLDFYQGLFGMPVQATRGQTRYLRIGAGPQFMAVSPTDAGEQASISHICLSSPAFDADRLMGRLQSIGFTRTDVPGGGGQTMRCWVSNPENGSPEVWFADASGLRVQLQDPSYCGGSGPLGNVCATPEPAAGKIALADLSHFTVFGSDGGFYSETMGFAPQAYQATTPALGVGDGIQFLMFAGGGGGRGGRGRGGGAAPAASASINHASFNMRAFDTDMLIATLEDFGLTGATGNTGPMVHYISLRMPNRGGAEGGTPEFYFSDPDGLLMQIQDVTYCGGGGKLGEICEVE